MRLYRKKAALLQYLNEKKTSLGFVPTMGALHQGHLSLVEKAIVENKLVVVSIFVNPAQFKNQTALENYPHSLTEDIEKLVPFEGSLILFAPTKEELYGMSVNTNTYDFGSLALHMEGASRVNHFLGVATVVEKLFKLINPQKAYFGEKDFQQLQIIKDLVKQKKWDIEIIGCSVIRETNGLAFSSRNQLLTPALRDKAGIIHNTLLWVTKQGYKTKIAALKKEVERQFEKQQDFQLDYFCIAEEETLVPATEFSSNKSYRAFIAVNVVQIRLIDNMLLTKI
tara:strand:+ start:13117 stop:13962 length:846 start_codon:yes stop_codon:yes gene_type:complete